MSFQPSPIQALILWWLLTHEGQAYQKEIRPSLRKPNRDILTQAGFIEHEQRRSPKGGRSIHIQLTDKAWAWAGEHMHAPLSSRSNAAGPIFQAFLTKLQPVLRQHQITLAEILSSPAASPQAAEQQLREAYFALSQGKSNVRVRLAPLRQRLAAIPRPRLDALLLQLQTEGKLVLYPLDDPQDIAPEDRRAALNVAGFERHIVYLQK